MSETSFRDSHGKNVEVLVTPRGNVPTEWQDQSTDIVDIFLCRAQNDVTLAANAVIDTNTLTLVAGHGFVADDYICIRENSRFYQARVVSVNVNVITLDLPLDYAFTTAALASRRTINMNVDGSVTPITFFVSPPPGTTWDICRMIITMADNASMDDGKFGGITGGLARGVVFRKKNHLYKNIFAARNNGDFRSRSFDVQYLDASLGPGGLYGFGCRRSFNGLDKNGVTIRLSSDTQDEFQCIVQDDLTSLSSLRVVIQGHVVE